jgi:hypothetical protein
MIPAGRLYLDPGDRLTGRYDPPRRCHVLTQWAPGGGPRNVRVRYDDGTTAVIPFSRRLRRADAAHDFAALKLPDGFRGGSPSGSIAVPPRPRRGGTVTAGVSTPPALPGPALAETVPDPAQPSSGVGADAGAPAGGGHSGRLAPVGVHDDGVGGCAAMVPVGGGCLAPCPEPTSGRYRGECGCKHSRDRNLCAGHAQYIGESGCLECLTMSGTESHDCLLTVTEVAL